MAQYVKFALNSLKYAAYFSSATLLGSFGFLQYINSVLGGIEIDKQQSTRYYIQQLKMQPKEASRMYYWLIFDISAMRVFSFLRYQTYCRKLKDKFIDPNINRYENAGLITKIANLSDQQRAKPNLKLFNQVKAVRALNLQALEREEYIVREVRKGQKMMDTRRIIGVGEDTLQKVETIHQYVCTEGVALGDKEVRSYVEQLAGIERRMPGDWLHKIMFI